jgi:hypothetical protein
MARHHMPQSFREIDRPEDSPPEVVSAWVIIALLLLATAIGFFLDRVATVAP